MANFLHLEGENFTIMGATRVASTTPTQAVVEQGNVAVLITGNNIEVKKLNLENGEVVLSGKFLNIKFGDPSAKNGSLVKRIFK